MKQNIEKKGKTSVKSVRKQFFFHGKDFCAAFLLCMNYANTLRP